MHSILDFQSFNNAPIWKGEVCIEAQVKAWLFSLFFVVDDSKVNDYEIGIHFSKLILFLFEIPEKH